MLSRRSTASPFPMAISLIFVNSTMMPLQWFNFFLFKRTIDWISFEIKQAF